jgi:hypothetical protein
MSKRRLITSYSDVITNSSTQVFFLDIEEKLINLLNENNITDKVIIINSKEDVIRAVEFYQKEEDSGGYGNSEIFNLINFVYEWYDMYTEYGKGDKWKELNDAGKTDREIIDFISFTIFSIHIIPLINEINKIEYLTISVSPTILFFLIKFNSTNYIFFRIYNNHFISYIIFI